MMVCEIAVRLAATLPTVAAILAAKVAPIFPPIIMAVASLKSNIPVVMSVMVMAMVAADDWKQIVKTEQCESDDDFAGVMSLLVFLHLQQYITKQQQGEGEIGHVERETKYCQNPCSDGRADVGAHDDADASQDLLERVGGDGGEDAAHTVTSHFLKTVT